MTNCRWNKYCFCNYMILCSRPTIAWTTSTVRARALSKRWSSTLLLLLHPWRRCAPAPATTACTNSWETASRSWTRASGTTRISSPPAETMSRLSWSTFCYTQISCRAGRRRRRWTQSQWRLHRLSWDRSCICSRPSRERCPLQTRSYQVYWYASPMLLVL